MCACTHEPVASERERTEAARSRASAAAACLPSVYIYSEIVHVIVLTVSRISDSSSGGGRSGRGVLRDASRIEMRASVSAAQRQRATAIKMESNAHGAPNGGRGCEKHTLARTVSQIDRQWTSEEVETTAQKATTKTTKKTRG